MNLVISLMNLVISLTNLVISLINDKKTIIKKNKLIFIYNVYNSSLRFYLLINSSFIIKIIRKKLKALEKYILLKNFNLHHFM